jgi:hypothetical protein
VNTVDDYAEDILDSQYEDFEDDYDTDDYC